MLDMAIELLEPENGVFVDPFDRKAGRFVTIEGRPVFVGGPGAGGGTSGGGTQTQEVDWDGAPRRWEEEHYRKTNQWGNETWKESQEALTDREKELVKKYTGNSYKQYNDCLRGNCANEQIQQESAELVGALYKGRTPENVVVFRGTSGEHASFNPGDVITESNILSTALDINEAAGWSKGVLLEIRVPEGTPSLFPGRLSSNRLENEVMLPPGLRMRVLERGMMPQLNQAREKIVLQVEPDV